MTEKYLWLAGKIKKGEIVMEGQRKTRLLLADDSITIRRVVEMTLPSDRFQITSVGDGEAALAALESERPDVLLADVIMPKMDGYELCSVVRSSPEFKDIPVILLVGTFENYDEVRGREAGADDHIVKPFETSDLIDKIRGVMARAEEATASAQAPLAAAVEGVADTVPEAVTQNVAGSEELAVEHGDEVEFTERESVELEEGGSGEGVVEPFETLSDIPHYDEYCAEAAPCPEPERPEQPEQEVPAEPVREEVFAAAEAPQEVEPDAGDESFPWEEDIDLPVPEVQEVSPVVAESPVTEVETPVRAEDEHVFSLADFKPDVLEALEKGHEIPEVHSAELTAGVAIASLAAAETVQVEEAVPAVSAVEAQAVEAVETASAVETVPLSPAPISGDSLQALQECIEKSVRAAVVSAFGDLFKEAVEKAAKDVVPALVEKAVREELQRQRG